jgi:hypothetical protein
MNQLLSVLSIVVSIGIVTNFSVESVNAWHAEFSSKEECIKAVNETTDNKIGEAKRVCERLIPHNE